MTPKFNRTNANIDWAAWTWNPVTGCRHGCPYCYARDIAMRFTGHFDPTFHPDRLQAPHNTKPRILNHYPIGERCVFVCSMADLFGEWVPDEWIQAVLDEARKASQWEFIFLTKNPTRLLEFKFPSNSWIGTTVDRQTRVEAAVEVFKNLSPVRNKFLSCEPLLERITTPYLNMFDWLIIGGQSRTSGCPAFQPEWAWVQELVSVAKRYGDKTAVYMKPNLVVPPGTERLKEYPG